MPAEPWGASSRELWFAMVRDAAYQSRTPDFWASCDGLGGPATYKLWGTSADGKGEPGQTNAVSHGCPPARFRAGMRRS